VLLRLGLAGYYSNPNREWGIPPYEPRLATGIILQDAWHNSRRNEARIREVVDVVAETGPTVASARCRDSFRWHW
jgi:hypothetical protein